jgi:drug/metabolite transporter (DMT)-like permease
MDEKEFRHGPLKAGFSGAVVIGWIVFFILFLAFFSEGYRTNEKVAIVILSLLVVVLLLGGLWAFWSLRMMSKKDWGMFKIKGFRWRIAVSVIYPLALLIFLVYAFWFLWTDFGFWQYLAIIVVVLLISGGILGAIWGSWGLKYKGQMEEFGKEFGKKFEEGFKPNSKT